MRTEATTRSTPSTCALRSPTAFIAARVAANSAASSTPATSYAPPPDAAR